MRVQLWLSSLFLAVLLGVGLAAGLIAFSPALTRTYYVHMALLILGAGACVTVYNRYMAGRIRRRADVPTVPAAECGPPAEPAADAHMRAVLSAELPAAAADPAETSDAADGAAEVLPADLDTLLDIAYESSAADPARAIRVYREALARYPDDSYIPYLVIELSTLYKNMGDYGAARELFTHALTLPVIEKSEIMVQELRRSLRHLDAVALMLAMRGTPELPFGAVPKELLDAANRRADREASASNP